MKQKKCMDCIYTNTYHQSCIWSAKAFQLSSVFDQARKQGICISHILSVQCFECLISQSITRSMFTESLHEIMQQPTSLPVIDLRSLKPRRKKYVHLTSRIVKKMFTIKASSCLSNDFMENQELTVDPPTIVQKELPTCRFCCQQQAKESQSTMVFPGGCVAHFEIQEHCLYQQHQLHICLCIHQKIGETLVKEIEGSSISNMRVCARLVLMLSYGTATQLQEFKFYLLIYLVTKNND